MVMLVEIFFRCLVKQMSRNVIAKTRNISKISVSEIFRIADLLGITFSDIGGIYEEKTSGDIPISSQRAISGQLVKSNINYL